MSPSDKSSLWQSPKASQYHLNYEPQCLTGYSFGTLCHFDAALDARYGAPAGLSQYVEEAQAQNYENTRAQFEAFLDHANHAPVPSTGTIYWQLNKGWPSLLWNLYGSDGDQAGSYFGTQEANRPLHALYALDNGTVALDNLGGASQSGLSVEAKVYNRAGTVLDDQTARGITLASQQLAGNVLTPKVPSGKPARAYFVELLPKQRGSLVDRDDLLAVHPARRGELAEDAGPAAGRDDPVRGPDVAAHAARVVRVRHRRHGLEGRAQPAGSGHHGYGHQYLGVHRRVPAPRRRAAGRPQRPGTAGRQRAAILDLVRQRHHVVPGRVADPDRDLRPGRPEWCDPGDQPVRLECAQARRRGAGAGALAQAGSSGR
jgi:hypothetical protein